MGDWDLLPEGGSHIERLGILRLKAEATRTRIFRLKAEATYETGIFRTPHNTCGFRL